MFSVYFAACSILLCTQLASAQVAECDFLTPGKKSGVICLSKTAFVFGFQDPAKDRPSTCAEGKVCADVPEICATNQTPVCKNSKVGDPATCNECIDDTPLGSPVCINKNEYSVCNTGNIQQSFVQKCPPETPYCKVKFDANKQVTSVCTYDSSQFDCPDDSTGAKVSGYVGDGENSAADVSTNEEYIGTNEGSFGNNGTNISSSGRPQTFKCVVAGFFADFNSSDCTSYFKCQPTSNGGFDQLKFACSQAGSAFNPATLRCELGYKCE